MTTEELKTKELYAQLDEALDLLLAKISGADKNKIDVVPFKDSWTPAQLMSHVTKSIKAIAQALEMRGKHAERNPGERVEELKKMFLDFNAKYQSPEFILPTKKIYSKDEIIEKFKNSVEQLKDMRSKANLSDVISLPAFGEITKFELLNFIVFHTIRHTHQLQNILSVLEKS